MINKKRHCKSINTFVDGIVRFKIIPINNGFFLLRPRNKVHNKSPVNFKQKKILGCYNFEHRLAHWLYHTQLRVHLTIIFTANISGDTTITKCFYVSNSFIVGQINVYNCSFDTFVPFFFIFDLHGFSISIHSALCIHWLEIHMRKVRKVIRYYNSTYANACKIERFISISNVRINFTFLKHHFGIFIRAKLLIGTKQ